MIDYRKSFLIGIVLLCCLAVAWVTNEFVINQMR